MTDSARVPKDHIGHLRKQIALREREIERLKGEIAFWKKAYNRKMETALCARIRELEAKIEWFQGYRP